MGDVTARVFVTPKRGILDPQGKAVQQSLHALGFTEVADVRVGKCIELRLRDTTAAKADERVRAMGERLLANGVIEDFRVEIAGGADVRWGVVTFPGSNDDRDARAAITRVLGDEAIRLWHKDDSLGGVDCVVLPGGFSYGDYLRCGAIARFSPIMEAVMEHAAAGGGVLGICNGFQVLCEAGLLPGALVANRTLRFVCRDVRVRVETVSTVATAACRVGDVLSIPVKHGEGCYVASEETLRELLDDDRIVFRYCDAQGRVGPDSNPNGSLHDVAGVCNAGRNVVGMMPHPEHAVDRVLGSDDGMRLFRSIRSWFERRGSTGHGTTQVVPGP